VTVRTDPAAGFTGGTGTCLLLRCGGVSSPSGDLESKAVPSESLRSMLCGQHTGSTGPSHSSDPTTTKYTEIAHVIILAERSP